MQTDGTPSLTDEQRDYAQTFAQLHECRMAIVDSLLWQPDDTASREPLWSRMYDLLDTANRMVARLWDAVRTLDGGGPESLQAQKAADAPRWYYGADAHPLADAPELPRMAMPAAERDRLADLYYGPDVL